MKKKTFGTIFRNIIVDFITSVSALATVVGAFFAIMLGDWKIFISTPFVCILIGLLTAWVCTLILGKDE